MRSFFAIFPSPSLKKSIVKLIAQLKKDCVYQDIKWTKPRNLHLTLRFMGEVTQEQLSTILQDLSETIKNLKPFVFQLTDLIYFPTAESPIALVLQPSFNLELNTLAAIINDCVLRHGVNSNHQIFKPHLTLARIKAPHKVEYASLNKIYLNLPELIFPVNEIKLMHSEINESGSTYKLIKNLELNFV